MSAAAKLLREERKALLATRAELDRARVALSVRQVRAIVRPVPDAERVARLRPAAALLAGFAGTVAGAPRLARWLRIAAFALAALRAIRNWRR